MSHVAETKRVFREHGLAPKKWMGQNLLVNLAYLKKIVLAAEIRPGDTVVEVGAGLGVLTAELASRGARVLALEIDAGFFRVLEEKFHDSERIELIHADALKYDWDELAGRIGKLRVVANLPYNISSRLLFRFCENRDLFSSLHILVQREVAERLIAEPGTKDYGILTVLLGVTAHVELLFHIPPKAFFPVPAVTSTLVRITFPVTPPIPVADPGGLARLVKAAFAGRRKTLRNTLRGSRLLKMDFSLIASAADEVGIDLGRRAETLTPLEFSRFADVLHVAPSRGPIEETPGDS